MTVFAHVEGQHWLHHFFVCLKFNRPTLGHPFVQLFIGKCQTEAWRDQHRMPHVQKVLCKWGQSGSLKKPALPDQFTACYRWCRNLHRNGCLDLELDRFDCCWEGDCQPSTFNDCYDGTNKQIIFLSCVCTVTATTGFKCPGANNLAVSWKKIANIVMLRSQLLSQW